MKAPVFSVSEVNTMLRELIDCVPTFSNICVSGEISNYKRYPSGHHYFTLKDNDSCLKCVMFRSAADHLRFRPDNGQKVLAAGKISVYPRDGVYQLYCNSLSPFGMGDLNLAFEQIKKKLEQEGLYDAAHKKSLPAFPDTIAVITSPAGAAVHDIIRIIRSRWPMVQILVVPVKVQGEGAAEEIAAAITYVNRHKLADVIITGRGGGSLEDLWAFNEEIVARAIYASALPVISAVGHEPDITIADYVADVRASTPSNAAELVVKDRAEQLRYLQQLSVRLAKAEARRLTTASLQLRKLDSVLAAHSPQREIDHTRLRLDSLSGRLLSAQNSLLSQKSGRLRQLSASLEALSPLSVLIRGYAFAEKADGHILRSVKETAEGDKLALYLHDGKAICKVIETVEQV